VCAHRRKRGKRAVPSQFCSVYSKGQVIYSLGLLFYLRYGVCSSSEKRLIEGERAGKELGATWSPMHHMKCDIPTVTKVEYCHMNEWGFVNISGSRHC
jgi:hypothetical protein